MKVNETTDIQDVFRHEELLKTQKEKLLKAAKSKADRIRKELEEQINKLTFDNQALEKKLSSTEILSRRVEEIPYEDAALDSAVESKIVKSISDKLSQFIS